MKTFHIKTLGCKVNQCDSNEIREHLLECGWRQSCTGEVPDVCVVNTCCVTQHADRKSRSAIRSAVRKKNNSIVVVTGCYVRYDRPAILDIDGVDTLFENSARQELYKWLEVDRQPESQASENFFQDTRIRTRAFLKIQEGCDNCCSYCIVPFVRGQSRSKDITQIVDEASRLAKAGYKEVVLTGVCLGSFGKDLEGKPDLVDVINGLEEIKDLARIRLSSIDAADLTPRLIDKMAHSQKVCPHLHVPFQSGDDKVLRDMNKTSRVKDYLNIVQRAKSRIKDLAITCDFIVGFPTESEESFENTLDLLEFIAPLKTHIFTYSPRRGVSIFDKGSGTSYDNIKKRYQLLKKSSDELSLEFKSRYLGQRLSVLFEKRIRGLWQGYSKNYIKVVLESSLPLKNVISEVKGSRLNGEGILALM